MKNNKKDPPKKKEPIYVDSPNDPRYKAYQDSLSLYSAYLMQDKLMGPGNKKVNTSDYKWNTEELKENRKKKIVKGLEEYGAFSKDFQNEKDQFKDGYNFLSSRPEDQKLIKYYKSLGFTDDNIMYHSSPDVVNDKIRPIGTYNDGTADSPIYKKPVQPVEVRKEPQPIQKRDGRLTYDEPTLNTTPRPLSNEMTQQFGATQGYSAGDDLMSKFVGNFNFDTGEWSFQEKKPIQRYTSVPQGFKYGGDTNMKNNYMLGGALATTAKAFGANDTIVNALGVADGIGEMFFNPMGGGMDTLKYGSSLIANEVKQFGGLTEFQGPKHSEGGISLNPNIEVEGGETMNQEFIFSDAVKPKGSKLTYAQLSKRIENKYARRGEDKMALEAKQKELDKLKMLHESDPKILKGRENQQATEMKYGGYKYSTGGPLKKTQNTEYQSFVPQNENELMYNMSLYDSPQSYMDAGYGYIDQNDPRWLSSRNLPPSMIPKRIPSQLGDGAFKGVFDERVNPIQSRSNVNLPSSNLPNLNTQSNLDPYAPVTDFKRVSSLDKNHVNSVLDSYTNNTQSITPKDNAYLPNNVPQLSTTGALAKNMNTSPGDTRSTTLPSTNIPVTGALMNAIGPTSQLVGTLINGVDDVNLQRFNPEFVNYNPAVNIAQRNAADTRAVIRDNVQNNARNSGQALSNLVAGNVGVTSNVNDQVTRIKMDENNTNTQIRNQANQTNMSIGNEEQILRQQNKAAYRQAIYGALTDMGNIGAGYTRDKQMAGAQDVMNQRALDLMSSLPYRYGYFVDENGNIKTGVK